MRNNEAFLPPTATRRALHNEIQLKPNRCFKRTRTNEARGECYQLAIKQNRENSLTDVILIIEKKVYRSAQTHTPRELVQSVVIVHRTDDVQF